MTDKSSKNLPANIDFTSGTIFDRIINDFDSEITLYNQVMNQIDPSVFDSLESKKKHSVAGMSVIDGGIFEEKFSIAGRVSSKDDVFTKNLSVAGSSTFRGLVGASGKVSIAGKAVFQENALFGGKVSVAGSSTFQRNVVASGGISIAGRTSINEYLLADSNIKVDGTLNALSIRSNNILELRGKVFVDEDVIARHINLEGITGTIHGNLVAESVTSKSPNKLKEKREDRNLQTLGGLVRYVGGLLTNIFSNKKGRGLLVSGDLIADTVELHNINVLGNIYAKNIIIGDNVEVSGTIYYADTVELPEDVEYTIEKGFPESLDQENDTNISLDE